MLYCRFYGLLRLSRSFPVKQHASRYNVFFANGLAVIHRFAVPFDRYSVGAAETVGPSSMVVTLFVSDKSC